MALTTARRQKRALMLRIGGHDKTIWDIQNPPGTAESYDLDGISGLRAPTEHSSSVDLTTLEPSWSAITFEVADIDDPTADDGSKYWAKHIAPGKAQLSTTYVAPMVRRNETDKWLLPSAVTVDIKATADAANFPSSGDAWIGPERFSYTGKGGSAVGHDGNYYPLTGVTRGKYPALIDPRDTGSSTSFSRPILHTVNTGRGVTVSTERLSWIGSEVALYVVLWDESTGAWEAQSAATLVYYGYITAGIKYDPKGKWKITTESTLNYLERNVEASPRRTNLIGINLNGTSGRTFRINQWEDGRATHRYVNITVAQKYYHGWIQLLQEVKQLINTATWTTVSGVPSAIYADFDGDGGLVLSTNSSDVELSLGVIGPPPVKFPSHVLQALGFDIVSPGAMKMQGVSAKPSGSGGFSHETVFEPHKAPFTSYHPLFKDANGGKLALAAHADGALSDDQGDYSSELAYVLVEGEGDLREKTKELIAYTAVGSLSQANFAHAGDELTLAADYLQPALAEVRSGARAARAAYVGVRQSSSVNFLPQLARQVFVHTPVDANNNARGPFRMLLDMLTSTGAAASYNGTYDTLDAQHALSIPSKVIDDQSFLDADAHAAAVAPALFPRIAYAILEPTSWLELFQREAKLYGFVLSWSSGRITVKRPFDIQWTNPAATLTNSNSARSNDYPMVEMSSESAINRYNIEADYDRHEDEYKGNFKITDTVSRDTLGDLREVDLAHPGLRVGQYEQELVSLVISDNRAAILGLENQRIRRTLNVTLLNQIAVGDTVLLDVEAAHPDPFGSGALTCEAYGIVLSLSWEYGSGKYNGYADILLISSVTAKPWAPAALITSWDNPTNVLTCTARAYGRSADSVDVAAFSVGDECQIVERCCITPGSPAVGPIAVTVNAVDTGASTITLDTVDLSSLNTAQDYVLIFANASTAVAAQLAVATYAADNDSEQVNSGAPDYWG